MSFMPYMGMGGYGGLGGMFGNMMRGSPWGMGGGGFSPYMGGGGFGSPWGGGSMGMFGNVMGRIPQAPQMQQPQPSEGSVYHAGMAGGSPDFYANDNPQSGLVSSPQRWRPSMSYGPMG